MHRFSRLFFAVAVLLGCRIAAAQSADAETSPETLVEDLLYRDESELDDYGKDRCRLDLCLPTDQRDFATIIWFHGGGLTKGQRSIPKELRGKGFAIAAAGYRLSPDVKAPVYIEDAAAAVAWVLRHIEGYGGSPRKVIVSGHSAGGYLTLMIGLDKRWLQKHAFNPDDLAGLAPFSGQAMTHFTIRAERGIADTRPIIDDLAPLYHVRADAPPLLLVTGDRNQELLGRYEENAYLWRMFQEVKHPDVQLFELQGFNHGQMAQPAFPLLERFVARVTDRQEKAAR
ncbi:MAG: alpha/beta hydrolase [Planctomycetia bacterium]